MPKQKVVHGQSVDFHYELEESLADGWVVVQPIAVATREIKEEDEWIQVPYYTAILQTDSEN